eukprot:824351-Ditylum_brightwellii.AAC.1
MVAATATSTVKVKGGDKHNESYQTGGGSSKKEGQSMHFVSPPNLCNVSTLQSVTTASMGNSKMTTNTSVSDKNSKSVIDVSKVPVTPTNATATTMTAGTSPQINFYNSIITDSSIVFKYRAKMQEQINNQSQVGMKGDMAMFIGGSGGGGATIGVIAAVSA